MIKRVSIFIVFMLLLSMVSHGATPKDNNLCPNPGFDAPGNPLDGWMIDYAWSGNSWYRNNISRISALPTYKGKKGVLYMKGGPEVKVESPVMPFDIGTKYTCVVTYQNTAAEPHIYSWGYMWKPGVRPYYDKPIHLGDLRGIYKTDFRRHQYKTLGNGWKTATFHFPYDKPSKRAMQNLKHVRYFTIYVISVKGSGASVWIDNVKVTSQKDGLKFLTEAEQAAIDKKNADRKERLRKAAKEKAVKEKAYLSTP